MWGAKSKNIYEKKNSFKQEFNLFKWYQVGYQSYMLVISEAWKEKMKENGGIFFFI